MKRAAAIVTNRGGRTCHAAIIARELGIPAVVGCGDATETLKDGAEVTVSCAEGDTGNIYAGRLAMEVENVRQGALPDIPVKIMMNVGNPQLAFDFQSLPNAGVGLARLEFIINNNIGVHPKAVLDYPNLDAELKLAVERLSAGYANPRAFFESKLAEGIATHRRRLLAEAGHRADVRLQEQRVQETDRRLALRARRREPDARFPRRRALHRRLVPRVLPPRGGGAEEGPQRHGPDQRRDHGALRAHADRSEGRDGTSGGQRASRGDNGLRVIMMCEVPSNAVLADEFLDYFDGFSIGSNDLTQLTLGLDRDSALVAEGFDERDPAVKALLSQAISACLGRGKYIGICGQGPSDHADFAAWLMEQGIESISLNPDTVVETWQRLARPA